jgi:uncharacterized protein (DUF1778 family)
MARPKKQTDEVRTNILRIRLTADERRVLDEAARARSLDTSAWARSALLELSRRMLKKKK